MIQRHPLHHLAQQQHGLLDRSDLVRLGVSRGTRRGLVDRGELVPVRPKVFRVGGTPDTPEQRVLAAVLDRGAPAGGRTAAWLHGLDGFGPPGVVELLGRRPTVDADADDLIVRTTTWLPDLDIVTVRGIPTTAVARTVLSLCALVPHGLTWDRAKRTIDDACQRDLASDPWLWWRLERLRRSGRNGVRTMEKILVARGEGNVTESWLEAATLAVLGRAGLPMPTCQERIDRHGAFVARVDFLYPAERVVVEVNGHRPHRAKAQVQRDVERIRDLTLLGFRVLPFTYDDVVRHPEVLVDQVGRALGLARAA